MLTDQDALPKTKQTLNSATEIVKKDFASMDAGSHRYAVLSNVQK